MGAVEDMRRVGTPHVSQTTSSTLKQCINPSVDQIMVPNLSTIGMLILQSPPQIFIFHEVFPNYHSPYGMLLIYIIVCFTDSSINNYLLSKFCVHGPALGATGDVKQEPLVPTLKKLRKQNKCYPEHGKTSSSLRSQGP